jgi:hypothetical protein
MIKDENLEETRVTSQVYRDFLKYLGGWKFIIFSQLAMVCFTASKIANDYQVGNRASSEEQTSNFGFYCMLTFTYAVLTSFFVFLRSITL